MLEPIGAKSKLPVSICQLCIALGIALSACDGASRICSAVHGDDTPTEAGNSGGDGDDEYTCDVGSSDAAARREYRKLVVVYNKYVPGTSFGKLDVTRVAISYNYGPNNNFQADYEDRIIVRVEDESGDVFRWWSRLMPVLMPEDHGCVFPDPESEMIERFDFIEPRPRFLRVLDIDGKFSCGDGSHTGNREELLKADLKPCLDKFCAEMAVQGDPACP